MPRLLALGRGQTREGGSFESFVAGDSLPPAKKLLSEAAGRRCDGRPVDDRLAAIRLLGLGDPKTARQLLPELLDCTRTDRCSTRSTAGDGRLAGPICAGEILNRWKSMSPSVRREAVEVLFGGRKGSRRSWVPIEARSLASSELDLAPSRQLETHSNTGFRESCPEDLGAQEPAVARSSQVVAELSASD